jgi:hypothetical protein
MTGSNRITPEDILTLKANEIFVVFSNIAGKHSSISATIGVLRFGAKYGIGFGPSGKCWIIPTVDKDMRAKLPLKRIAHFVDKFIAEAKANPGKVYYVSEFRSGIGQWTIKDIAPLFNEAASLSNVYLPLEMWENIGEMVQ